MRFPRAVTVIALASASQLAQAQFVTPPKNLITKTGYAGVQVRYKEVPAGICEQNPDVKSYAGYADVSPGQHIFWWFFEARNVDPSSAPLTTWINGGPGSSSMIGLFQELGPCFVNSDGKAYNNPYSYTNATNMLFIDQPTTTGFSYTSPVPAYLDPNSGLPVQLPENHCPAYAADWSCGTYSYWNESLTANNTAGVAPNFWKTLQGFMGAFPQYSRHNYYFATESYGGHYGPIINDYIEAQNAANIAGAHPISLEGVLIGNGWYDPLLQYEAYYNFTVYPGNTYIPHPFNKSVENQMYNAMFGPGNCYDMTVDCNTRGVDEVCSYADNFCYQEVEYLYDLYLNRDEYDFRELLPDPFPPDFYVDYLNTARVQAAIGAYVNYSDSSTTVGDSFAETGDDDRNLTTVSGMLKLVQSNISVVMYHGDADYICNWLGGEAVAYEIGVPNFDTAGYVDLQTPDHRQHGQVKQIGKFSFTRIYESGHEVPFYQPLAALTVLERTIAGTDIATGKTKVTGGYMTSGPKKSNHFEGKSTVQFKIIPTDDTYNTTTDKPNPPRQKDLTAYGGENVKVLRGRRYTVDGVRLPDV